jgi:hypothetical protein
MLGFVLIKIVQPRKLTIRRGDIEFNFEEGGIAPSLKDGNVVITTEGLKNAHTGEAFVPPPEGGGKCITARDCYNYNGTCFRGACACKTSFSGSYCQVVAFSIIVMKGLI